MGLMSSSFGKYIIDKPSLSVDTNGRVEKALKEHEARLKKLETAMSEQQKTTGNHLEVDQEQHDGIVAKFGDSSFVLKPKDIELFVNKFSKDIRIGSNETCND